MHGAVRKTGLTVSVIRASREIRPASSGTALPAWEKM